MMYLEGDSFYETVMIMCVIVIDPPISLLVI